MARNEEKHFCNLNRLLLIKEKEEYEKAHPQRPRLDSLYTPEEIQKWLPSIKRDIDFYLKKSQVTCYSDAHVKECTENVVKLEKEFKAFVRKIKQLTPSPLDVIPWTSRPYKRKNSSNSEGSSSKEFKRIATPILDNEKTNSLSLSNDRSSQYIGVNWSLMDQPLTFSSVSINDGKTENDRTVNLKVSNIRNSNLENCNHHNSVETRTVETEMHLFSERDNQEKANQTDKIYSIVNYDSSDSESS